jgi:hypothetical protein
LEDCVARQRRRIRLRVQTAERLMQDDHATSGDQDGKPGGMTLRNPLFRPLRRVSHEWRGHSYIFRITTKKSYWHVSHLSRSVAKPGGNTPAVVKAVRTRGAIGFHQRWPIRFQYSRNGTNATASAL